MAEENGTKVRLIKPNVRKIMRPYMNIGVYVRVSSSLRPQLDSMANQVSAFTQRVNKNGYWRLADIYIDVRSGTETGNRSEFQRMLDDARDGKLEILSAVWIQSHDNFGNEPPFEYPLNPLFSNRYKHKKRSEPLTFISSPEPLFCVMP